MQPAAMARDKAHQSNRLKAILIAMKLILYETNCFWSYTTERGKKARERNLSKNIARR
jgi:hypothetical protein